MTGAREMFEGEIGQEVPEPTMDALDNRNLEILSEAWRNSGMESGRPRDWSDDLRSFVLAAMRKAGDEALLNQVTVRLERSFGSTHDVRAGAKLVSP